MVPCTRRHTSELGDGSFRASYPPPRLTDPAALAQRNDKHEVAKSADSRRDGVLEDTWDLGGDCTLRRATIGCGDNNLAAGMSSVFS